MAISVNRNVSRFTQATQFTELAVYGKTTLQLLKFSAITLVYYVNINHGWYNQTATCDH